MAGIGSDQNKQPVGRKSIRDLRGTFKHDGPPLSVEDMDEGITAYLTEKHRPKKGACPAELRSAKEISISFSGPPKSGRSTEVLETQIEEARNSWDD